MIGKGKTKKRYLYLFFAIILIIFIVKAGFNAIAAQNKPQLNISVSTDRSKYLVNEDINITYRIEPQPLELKDVNALKNKEILFVMDTSDTPFSQGNLNKEKDIARNFVNKFKDIPNVKISILNYDICTRNLTGLKSPSIDYEREELISFINNVGIHPSAPWWGSNIGDGLRRALAGFSKNDSKKYVVFMSKCKPNYYTSTRRSGPYYMIIDDKSDLYYSGNNIFVSKNGFDYALIMANEMKVRNITNFFIGFNGLILNNVKTIAQLSEASGGKAYNGKNLDSINDIFNDIADQIKADYIVDDIKFKFTLPNNITYSGDKVGVTEDGRNLSMEIPNIIYKLNDRKNKYIADPIEFSISLKSNKSGNYTMGDGWTLNYKAINGKTITQKVPDFTISVNSLEVGFDVERAFVNSKGSIGLGKKTTIQYKVNPKVVSVPSEFANRVNENNILSNPKIIETLPEGVEFTDTLSGYREIEVPLKYVYEKKKGGFYAAPVVIEAEITSDKPGKHILNNGKFSYNDFENILSSEKFNSLILKVEDEYILKQGLFDINKNNYSSLGENYIKNLDKINITDGSMNRLGAYVRSSGQDFILNINLMEITHFNMLSFNDISVEVYKVDKENKLKKINAPYKINGNKNLRISINGDSSEEYCYYIINYNFRVNCKNKNISTQISSKATIENSKKENILPINIVSLPDLF
ncbi:MAG: vWA domain-containing protein [Clostridium cadaveris]|uniref:vWA domain-containing protein n=1 Tax=Clostridium cadaveris TaxID=1529 RepID=UPI002A86CC02|nr:vWA domain-containing protein [Clostridium cadaveris]